MRLRVTSVDHSPEALHQAVPFDLNLLRMLEGKDRQDYWLGALTQPIELEVKGQIMTASHFVIAARWQGTRIAPLVEHLPINLAVVIDPDQIHEGVVDFEKSEFIAIGMANEVEGGQEPKKLNGILAGHIGAFFGRGTK